MDWHRASKDSSVTAEGFAFSGGGQMDVRLSYRTLAAPSPGGGNAVLLLHGTTGSGLQYLQPAFADPVFGPDCPQVGPPCTFNDAVKLVDGPDRSQA